MFIIWLKVAFVIYCFSIIFLNPDDLFNNYND